MELIRAVGNHIVSSFRNDEITTSMLLAVLVVSGILALYEFIVYQVVLHRSLYNKAFNLRRVNSPPLAAQTNFA